MGDSIFEFVDKFGYKSPFGNWVEEDFPDSSSSSKSSGSSSVNFLNKKSSYEINQEHLLKFKFYGYENWIYRKDYDVKLYSSNTALSISTKSWTLENGEVFLTNISLDKPGKLKLYISVDGYNKRTIDIEFIDSSKSANTKSIKKVVSEKNIKVLSKSLNSEGKDLELNPNGTLKEGQKRMYLFTVKAKGEVDEMVSDDFLSTYQMIYNDTFPVSSFSFTIDGQNQPLRPFAQFVSANSNENLLKKAMPIKTLDDINSFLKKAQDNFPNGLNDVQKLLYWNHGKEYDYKSSQADGYPIVYVKGVGIMEADHIGNIIFANIMGSPFAQSFHDGDYLQKKITTTFGALKGIDDPYDSYSLAIGATCGATLTSDDLIRVFSFNKSVTISGSNVKNFNYRMNYINHNNDTTMIYDESFTIYGD